MNALKLLENYQLVRLVKFIGEQQIETLQPLAEKSEVNV